MKKEYITEYAWSKIFTFLKSTKGIYVGNELKCRNFIESIYLMARTGAQWREMDSKFGNWNSIFKRFKRNGKNIVESYDKRRQVLPPHKEVREGIFMWQFKDGYHEWNYPHTVDMTVYRKSDISGDLFSMNFTSPNTMEAAWSGLTFCIGHKKGIFYELSKVLNIPLNKVQTDCKHNQHMNFATPQELLDLFNKGFKIEILKLFQLHNVSHHMNYVPTFILR